jgi:hypothetical protein
MEFGKILTTLNLNLDEPETALNNENTNEYWLRIFCQEKEWLRLIQPTDATIVVTEDNAIFDGARFESSKFIGITVKLRNDDISREIYHTINNTNFSNIQILLNTAPLITCGNCLLLTSSIPCDENDYIELYFTVSYYDSTNNAFSDQFMRFISYVTANYDTIGQA